MIKQLLNDIIRNPHSAISNSQSPDRSVYQSKDAKQKKIFDALEWLAAMYFHVPNWGEQMISYYGYYSNVSRGKRKKEEQNDIIPCIIEADGISPEQRKAWARLIQKIYEVNPLTCQT